MIAVIADDFTGAAEIGGVGLRHGFRVVIDTKVRKAADADILVIATDTRSLGAEQAVELVRQVTTDLLALNPDFIFKKVDSLLRGNVAAELMAQLGVSGKSRALVAPANPDLKRTIREGVYYYDGVPLGEIESGGRRGSRNSSLVTDLMGESAKERIAVISAGDRFPDKELVVGNVSRSEDLRHWAAMIDGGTIPAGGSGFFSAILESLEGTRASADKPAMLGKSMLYVCGSAFEASRSLVSEAGKEGRAVIYMPERLFCVNGETQWLIRKWADEIAAALAAGERVVMAVGRLDCDHNENLSLGIREAIAETVERVLQAVPVEELMIEGGATSFSVARRLGYTRFYPANELGTGVVRMKIEEQKDMFLTLKPGSYAWPDSVWAYPAGQRLK
ncbi:MAG: hypothetical protein ABS46_20670 [Cytophagaceae bacterium SCN 52-12]|nr:MAG: hypothetical protein ABS46_20670 [Cytophagaceae bacterium SCN 52-12]